MDLSFSRFDKGFDQGFDKAMVVSNLPANLAVLLVGVAARQAGSPTAASQARTVRDPAESTLLSPLDGTFNGPVAKLIVCWKEE